VTLSPVGEVRFESVPERWLSYQYALGDMGIALGKGDGYVGTNKPENYPDFFYDELPGVEFDASQLTDIGSGHKEIFYPETGNRVPSTDVADGYEAILDGPASLFSQTQKHGIRMANFLPALPLCDRWKMHADVLASDTGPQDTTLSCDLDHTDGLSSQYTAQDDFDSDVERTLARKWDRATTEWDLICEDDVLDLGAEVMLPDTVGRNSVSHPEAPSAVFARLNG
jgi:hypothetical protein